MLSVGDEGACDVLDRSQLIAREPSLHAIQEKLVGGLHFTGDEAGDSHLFCLHMSKVLRDKGVEFRYNCAVDEINKEGSLFKVPLASGEALKADAVVVAAGAHSPELVSKLGIKLPIKPAKGYSLTIPMDGWENKPAHLMADMNMHVGVNPLGGTHLRIAGTAEFAGYDRSLTEKRINNLVGLLEELFPDFAATVDRKNLNPWMGHRPMCCDGVPVLGKTRVEGLYLNTGHGHLGWTMAAASGRVVADTIMGHTPEVDMSEYSINRF